MRSFNSVIKSQDIFGHPITLNFNRQGDTFKTLLGGYVSIMIKILVLLFILMKSIILFQLKDNTYSQFN